MEQHLRFGVCVSCGRRVGIRHSSCPYCSEWVYLPAWFRWGRVVLCTVVGIVSLWMLFRDTDCLVAQTAAFRGFPASFVAAGVVALFFPESFDRDVILSMHDHVRCALRAIGISALLLVAGFAVGEFWTQSGATGSERAASALVLAGSVVGALAYGVSVSRIVGLACIVCAWFLA